MAASPTIRQFRSEDARSCSDIIRGCTEEAEQKSPDLKSRIFAASSPNALVECAKLYYVAVFQLGGQVAGVCGLDMNEIRLLYVSPGFHGRGIGSALLQHIESMIPLSFFSDIFVYSAPTSCGFYGTHGYRAAGEYSFEFAGIGIPTVFMAKPAGALDRKEFNPQALS